MGITDERLAAWVRSKHPDATPVVGSVEFGLEGYESNILVVSWIEQDVDCTAPLLPVEPGRRFRLAGSAQSEDVDEDLNQVVRELLEEEWKLGTPAPPAS